jgi:hypothetical protein
MVSLVTLLHHFRGIAGKSILLRGNVSDDGVQNHREDRDTAAKDAEERSQEEKPNGENIPSHKHDDCPGSAQDEAAKCEEKDRFATPSVLVSATLRLCACCCTRSQYNPHRSDKMLHGNATTRWITASNAAMSAPIHASSVCTSSPLHFSSGIGSVVS